MSEPPSGAPSHKAHAGLSEWGWELTSGLLNSICNWPFSISQIVSSEYTTNIQRLFETLRLLFILFHHQHFTLKSHDLILKITQTQSLSVQMILSFCLTNTSSTRGRAAVICQCEVSINELARALNYCSFCHCKENRFKRQVYSRQEGSQQHRTRIRDAS